MDLQAYQESVLDEVKVFANDEIRPFAGEFDANEALPKDYIMKIAQKGYLGACFPKEYGGLGLDPLYYGLVTEEIAKACCATRSILTVHTSLVGETLVRWGTKEQKNKWLYLMAAGNKLGAFALTEPEVGTDAKSIQTTYKKQGNTYILNGKKKWITFGDIADFFIVIANCEGVISAFIVERDFEGVTTVPIKGLLCARATHIAEIEFNNVVVPEENLLLKEGTGFTYIASAALDFGRYSIAWGGVGLMQSALEAMVSYSRKREQFGVKICKHQLIKELIANAVTSTHAARALCISAGQKRIKNQPDAITETTIAKYFVSKAAMNVAMDAVQVHGGNGFSNKYPVERLFREAKLLEVIEGTSQIQQEIISNYGLRNYYKKNH